MTSLLPPVVLGKGAPCTRCLKLAWDNRIRLETVMPIPDTKIAALACVPSKHEDAGPCCVDCAAADTLVKMGIVIKPRRNLPKDLDQAFLMARVCVGNDRQEQLRLPGAPMGLVLMHIVRPCAEGDLEKHHAWMDEYRLPWHADGG